MQCCFQLVAYEAMVKDVSKTNITQQFSVTRLLCRLCHSDSDATNGSSRWRESDSARRCITGTLTTLSSWSQLLSKMSWKRSEGSEMVSVVCWYDRDASLD